MSHDLRRYALAQAAWARIDRLGHDPVESIARAIAEALAPEHGALPACYENLAPRQRELVLALYGEGWVRRATLKRRLAVDRNGAAHSLAQLARLGLVERHPLTRGLYRLRDSGAPVTIRNRPGCLSTRMLVTFLRGHGAATPAVIARHFGLQRGGMHRRLRRLVGEGILAHADGAYTAGGGAGQRSQQPGGT